MKRLCFTLLVSCAFFGFAPAALFADVSPCKYCGSSNFGSVQQMLASPCSKSPRKYHDAL